ncbi:MAG TPA: hypothetical protein PKK48_08740, partial [Phycisphaerae bacterium]|nr:hypothetical protein [Phycisphaerae bacterium]
ASEKRQNILKYAAIFLPCRAAKLLDFGDAHVFGIGSMQKTINSARGGQHFIVVTPFLWCFSRRMPPFFTALSFEIISQPNYDYKHDISTHRNRRHNNVCR